MTVSVPQTVGRYRLVRLIAHDSLGETHLADDTQSRCRVVMRLLPQPEMEDPARIKAFYALMERLTRIEHPHLASVLDVGFVDGRHYVTTAATNGLSLDRRLLPDHPWPTKAAVSLVRQLASALHRLHQNGIVHQDLHPLNILLRDDEKPLLVDVGVASWLPTGRGSSQYLAPEQIKGGTVGPTADVWALGVLLYQLLTSRHPFAAPIEAEVRMRVQHLKVDPPTTANTKLNELFERVLARNPRHRPASMTELSKLLGEADELPALMPLAGVTVALPGKKKDKREAKDSPLAPVLRGEGTGVRDSSSVPREDPLSPALAPVVPGARESKAAPELLEVPDEAPPLLEIPPPLSPRRRLLRMVGLSAAGLVFAIVLGLTSGWWLPGKPVVSSSKGEPPSVRIRPLEEMTLIAGKSQSRTIRIERTNCEEEILLHLDGHLDGLTVRMPPIPAGQSKVDITLDSQSRLKSGPHVLKIVAVGPNSVRAQTELTLLVKPELRLAKRMKNSIGMDLTLLPVGKFTRGSPETEAQRSPDEGPQHEIEITEPFYLGVYEVTQAEYEKVMEENPSTFRKGGSREDEVKGIDTSRFPVENVTWEKAVEFCKKLSENADEKKRGHSYRLPTEAEWEFACRGGNTIYQVFHYGDKLSAKDHANFEGTSPYGGAPKGPYRARPVAVDDRTFKPNAFGLYHMHGNVWEWCSDWYDEGQYQKCLEQGIVRDPRGPEKGLYHVLRGGSWYYNSWYCRSATRFWLNPGDRLDDIGFRVVCIVTPP